MDDYEIIRLLCSSQRENIELAKHLCDSQGWNIKGIIAKYWYPGLFLGTPESFLNTYIQGDFAEHVPSLLPSSATKLTLYKAHITKLPTLPACLKRLECSYTAIEELPDLPDTLEYLECTNTLITKLPDKLPPNLTFCDVTLNPNLPKSEVSRAMHHCVKNIKR